MRENATKTVSLLLAVTLAANCAFPCYAWADDLSEVSNGYEDDRGTRTGNEPVEGSDEPEAYQESPEAAGAGEEALREDEAPREGEEQSYFGVSVSAGSGGSGSLDAVEQTSDNLAYSLSDGIEYGDGGPDESFGGFGGVDDLILPDGIMALAATIGTISTQLDVTNNSLAKLESYTLGGPGYISGASNRTNWGVGNEKWHTAQGGVAWLVSYAVWYLDKIRTNTNMTQDYTGRQLAWSKSAWGWNNEGTSVVSKNSPGWYMAQLYDYTSTLLAWSRETWGQNYSGTRILYSESPAGWLQAIRSNTNTTQYYLSAPDKNGTSYSAAYWLRWIDEYLQKINTSLDDSLADIEEYSRLTQYYLSATSSDGKVYSAAYWLRWIDQALTGSLPDIKDDVGLSRSYLIAPDKDGNNYSVAYWLRWIRQYMEILDDDLIAVKNYLQPHSSLVSKGFSDVLAKLDGLKVDAEVSLDMSGVESRLDGIASLLLLAGAKDLVDSIVGELDTLKLAALSGQVEAAVQQAFPFCIPAVLKQCLGLVRAEASPPCIEFDVWGAPLVLDFAPYQGFADLSGWACRILFVGALLYVSPRFIWRGAFAE